MRTYTLITTIESAAGFRTYEKNGLTIDQVARLRARDRAQAPVGATITHQEIPEGTEDTE